MIKMLISYKYMQLSYSLLLVAVIIGAVAKLDNGCHVFHLGY